MTTNKRRYAFQSKDNDQLSAKGRASDPYKSERFLNEHSRIYHTWTMEEKATTKLLLNVVVESRFGL
jgi:hypothetical protein